MTPMNRLRPFPQRILAGANEPIFDVLPERVLDNLRRSTSENALVWNLVYPLARPTLSLSEWMRLKPLWGTPGLAVDEDDLQPYFWGYGIAGNRLGSLAEVLADQDGPGPKTEVDLFFVGRENLVLAEAKHMGALGRCSRLARGRCPEIQASAPGGETCRYWDIPGVRFDRLLDFGPRPTPGDTRPPCGLHYQMARTLLVGDRLAARLGVHLHLWLITPQRHWKALQASWLDFVDRVRDEGTWRRLRVLAWEDVRALS